MSDRTIPQSVEHLFEPRPAGTGAAWNLQLTTGYGYVNLRGDPGKPEFVAAVVCALSQDLPLEPNTVSEGTHRIYWLGPDEWLVATQQPQQAELVRELRNALADCHAAVTDLSAGLVRLVLSGQGVEDLLAKGCALDLHPSVFGPGHCAQTGLAKAGVLLARAGSAERGGLELYLRRSFAGYVLRWLAFAGREEGIVFEAA